MILKHIPPIKDYYEILGVRGDATHDEIKAAYHGYMIVYNIQDDELEKDLEDYLEIREAYEILADPLLRIQYDKKLFGHSQLQKRLVSSANLNRNRAKQSEGSKDSNKWQHLVISLLCISQGYFLIVTQDDKILIGFGVILLMVSLISLRSFLTDLLKK